MIEYNELKVALAHSRGARSATNFAGKRPPRDSHTSSQSNATRSPSLRRPTASPRAGNTAISHAKRNGVETAFAASEDAGEVIIEPTRAHSHTVILLHSMHASAATYLRLCKRFGLLSPTFKFVFPHAPQRMLHTAAGKPMEVSTWFSPGRTPSNQLDWTTADEISLAAQAKRVHTILDREAELLGGDCSRLVIGGTHAGGSLALHVAMTYNASLGAIICLRTRFLDDLTTPEPSYNQTPVFVFAADNDRVHPLHAVRSSFQVVRDAGFNIIWHVEPDLNHHAESLNELRYAAYWIAHACLGPERSKVLRHSPLTARKPKLPKPEPLPAAPPRPHRSRAHSARPASHGARGFSGLKTGFLHSLLREPDWRGAVNEKPAWDTGRAPGFIAVSNWAELNMPVSTSPPTHSPTHCALLRSPSRLCTPTLVR